MAGVDEYDFVVLVHTVLIDPIRVQHSQVATTTANAFFRNTLKATLELEMVDTLADRFAICRTWTRIKNSQPSPELQ